jgi:hypothetical protein
MIHLIQALLGAIVWSVANVVYVDMKRKGLRGFTRFAAFWAGTPTTWITFFAVPEGSVPTFHPPEADEEQRLLEAIRHDRASRDLPAEAHGEAHERRPLDDGPLRDRGAPGRDPADSAEDSAPLARPKDRG